MNWTLLFQNQAKLDNHIEEKHPREEGEDRLQKKVVAFQVELGEMANEWRGFKFWSENQSPKPMSKVLNKSYHPMLEEFIDVVHFTASIGLELGIDSYKLEPYEKGSSDEIKLVQDLFFTSSFIGYRHDQFNMYNVLINCVDHLGTELGFTDEEIMDAYENKNATNFKRQESGY